MRKNEVMQPALLLLLSFACVARLYVR